MDDDARRELWRQWCRASEARGQAWAARLYANPPPPPVPFPAELAGLTCGARTRAGTACKRRDLYRSGRCKLHGGLSTGPRTDAGKAAASRNGRRTDRTPWEEGKT